MSHRRNLTMVGHETDKKTAEGIRDTKAQGYTHLGPIYGERAICFI